MLLSRHLAAHHHPQLPATVAFAAAPLARLAIGSPAGGNVSTARDHLRDVRLAIMAADCIDSAFRAQLVEQLTLAECIWRAEAPDNDGGAEKVERAEAFDRLGTAAKTLLALDALAWA
jgi:hypothetical protein